MPTAQRSPLRIVSLAPSATNILVALGARRALVGVSKWCESVTDVKGLPVLGDCWSLDPEVVIRLRPTLVIGSVPFKAETVGKLLEKPVNFLAQNPRTLADIYRDIRMIGSLVGRVEAAERVVARMQRAFAALARKSHGRRRPLVYCEAWPNPRISSPPWVAELVEMAGGKIAVPAGERVGDEQIAQAAPEVMVLAWTAVGERSKPETALRNPAWQQVPAVRRRQVFAVRDEWLNTPAPILVRGARELFRIIHKTAGAA